MAKPQPEDYGAAPVPAGKAVKRKDRIRKKKVKWPSENVNVEMKHLMEWLKKYAEDMHTWGQRVRKDIRKLETHTNLGHGDPGDPPAPPW